VINIIKELQEIRKLLSLQKEVLTLDEFCAYSGISKNQAYHLTSTRKIKFYRPFGKLIYFKQSEVVEFLTDNASATSSGIEKTANYNLLNKR
jgi:excisionase family DNA binding protein